MRAEANLMLTLPPLLPLGRFGSPSALLLALVLSCEAHAWQVFIQVSCETTLRGSSETSTAASRADRASRRSEREDVASRAPAGSQCDRDDECYGWCEQGRCVDTASTQPVAPAQSQPRAGPTAINCTGDETCAPAYRCLDGQCVARPAPEPMPAPITRCEGDGQCAPGQQCVNGQCLSPPPMPPSSSLHRRLPEPNLDGKRGAPPEELVSSLPPCDARGDLVFPVAQREAPCPRSDDAAVDHAFHVVPLPEELPRSLQRGDLSPPASVERRGAELFLTSRAVQLRQDLALGEGPVISTLAAIRRVPASTLGRQLRARRAELISLIGDADERWASRFLSEVEALSPPCVRLSAR